MVINHTVKYWDMARNKPTTTTTVVVSMGVLLTIGAILVTAPSAYAEKTCTGICKNHGDTTVDNSQDNDVTTTTNTDNDVTTTTNTDNDVTTTTNTDNDVTTNTDDDVTTTTNTCTAPGGAGGSVTGGGAPGTGGGTAGAGGAGGCNNI
jgi:hypothetical protein